MALEQEVPARQQDVADARQIAAELTTLAPDAAQALALARQFAAALSTPAQQLTALAAGVHDPPSSAQAFQTAQPILNSARAALQPLATAEQTWSSLSALATRRSTWLQQRWQQAHTGQAWATANAMADPLAQALNAYSAAVSQLDASMHGAVIFPPNPAQEVIGQPPVVADWLTACAQQLTRAVTAVPAVAADIGAALPWTNLEAAGTDAIAAAQNLLATAQRVAAALTGTVDPATLADRLADLTALRLAACPDPITPADRALYSHRMTELDQALSELLGASTAVPATVPLALPPVRLEVRTLTVAGGGTEFRIRVYPDSFHIDAHDPRLTTDEEQWAQHLKTTAAANNGTLPADEWAQAAARFGPARAAYLLNPDPNAGTRPGQLTRPATATALPDQWLAIGYGPDGTQLAAVLGSPIAAPLQVADPAQTITTTTPGEPAVDPAVRWMIDFDEAVGKGMGLRLLVDGGAAGTPADGAATGPATLSTLLVIGVRAAEATATLTGQLDAHHYTSGLELVSYGTATNNTAAGPSGFSTADPGYARSYTTEVLRPAASGDAARLAAALGVSPNVFAAAAAAPLTQQLDQQAMTALTWQATWGSFLTTLTGMSQATAEHLRKWAVAWARPGGPLPTLRVGSRPYGLLPVLDLAQWADPGDTAAANVHSVVTGLVGPWLAADPARKGLDFDALLARTPVTAGAWGRFTGIMPGWLAFDYGLGVGYDQIQASIGALPGQLATIGADCGLGGPLSWPAGFVALPDPLATPSAAPWPLLNDDGTPFPFIAGAVPPATYLGHLLGLGGPETGQPTALLDFIARQSWVGTSSTDSTGTWAFVPRGNLGDFPEPTAPAPLDELTASIKHLIGSPDADYGALLGGSLDASSHRLDAWVTALATSRLGQLRQARQAQVYLGGFGWVENLVAREPLKPVTVPDEPDAVADPAIAGYQLAPSLQQAITAAVLRSGYLTHNPPGDTVPAADTPFAIDLSSRRARLATWLLDGVRQGQPLSALLGYRFERALQEAGDGDLIDKFRQAVPYSPVTTTNLTGETQGEPTESAAPSDVTDGVALYQLWQAETEQQNPPALPPPLASADWTRARQALAVLADSVDAVADAVAAQALHEALTGNTYGAAGAIDSVASGVVPPPQLSFLNTVRDGAAVTHRLLVPVPAGQQYPPAGWPATPRGEAEPSLTSWLAGLLGDPAQAAATVTLTDATGAPLSGDPVPVTLASLGLGPLDVAALAARPVELENLAVHTVLAARPAGSPVASGGTLDASPSGATRPLSAVLAIAKAAGQLIGASRGADARDLAPAATVTVTGANFDDLAARVHGSTSGPVGVVAELKAAADAFTAALPGDPPPGSGTAPATGVPAGADPATLAAALVKAVLLGVAAAAPAGTGEAALPVLVAQARGARTEIARRQAAVTGLEPAAGDTEPARLAARLNQLTAALGAGFRALPVITTTPADLVAQAASLTDASTADPGQGADAWLVKAGRVRQPVADLLGVCCAAEALGSGPPLSLTIAQLPMPKSAQPWAGLPYASSPGTPPAPNTLSLVMTAPAAPPGAFAALVVTDWTEVIPSQQQVAGLAYHYDAPNAQAPQCILLAVPARLDTVTWSYADLASTVTAARDVAHIRGVDYADLPAPARLVLPAAYYPDSLADKPGPWVPALPALSVPANYTQQTPDKAKLISVSPASLAQGQALAQLAVTGANFAPAGVAPPPPPVTAAQFSVTTVDGSTRWVTVSAANTIGDTEVNLTVSVDAHAPTGPASLTLGTSTIAGGLTITPQPLATYCDTARLAQAMTPVTQVITVTGQAFSRPAATIALSAVQTVPGRHTNPVSVRVSSSSTASVLLITATIAASSYTPYEPPDSTGNKALIFAQAASSGGTHYRPPSHVLVNLTLTVAPAPNATPNTFSFPIVVDTIV